MNRRKVSIQVLLYFLMMMFLMVIGCSKSDDTPPAAAFSQADLTGTWHVNMLKAGSSNEWMRATVTANSTGILTFSSCLDSSGGTTCPTGPIVWTINSSGVVSETDNGTATDSHYTMTSNKNFIAGTGTSDTDSYQLLIVQKEVTGTTYASGDLQSKSFVYHMLSVGAIDTWIHGIQTTDSTGAITMTSVTTPSGTTTPGATGLTFLVDSSGAVTMTGGNMGTFQGFLSDDKKTIVGTFGNGVYNLIIFQITTGQSDTAGALPAETAVNHELACGASPAPLWAHETITVASGGGITESDWVSNPPTTLSPMTMTGSITSTGTVTIAEDSSYNGQMSYDGKFTVSTTTRGSDVYSLQVLTQ